MIEIIVPGHIFAGTIGTILLLTSFVSFGVLPVRLIGVALLVASVVFFVLEVKAPGLGIWSIAGLIALVAGGLFLYDGSGGVHVSPWVLAAVAGMVALFFGVAVSKLIAMRHIPPVPHGAEAIIGKDGVVVGPGSAPTAWSGWPRRSGARSPDPVHCRGTRGSASPGSTAWCSPWSRSTIEQVPASVPAEGGTTG